MKIIRSQLKQIIKEELARLIEAGPPLSPDAAREWGYPTPTPKPPGSAGVPLGPDHPSVSGGSDPVSIEGVPSWRLERGSPDLTPIQQEAQKVDDSIQEALNDFIYMGGRGLPNEDIISVLTQLQLTISHMVAARRDVVSRGVQPATGPWRKSKETGI